MDLVFNNRCLTCACDLQNMLMQMGECMSKTMQINVQTDVQIISHYCMPLALLNAQTAYLVYRYVYIVCISCGQFIHIFSRICLHRVLNWEALTFQGILSSAIQFSAGRGKYYGLPLESSISPEDKC